MDSITAACQKSKAAALAAWDPTDGAIATCCLVSMDKTGNQSIDATPPLCGALIGEQCHAMLVSSSKMARDS